MRVLQVLPIFPTHTLSEAATSATSCPDFVRWYFAHPIIIAEEMRSQLDSGEFEPKDTDTLIR